MCIVSVMYTLQKYLTIKLNISCVVQNSECKVLACRCVWIVSVLETISKELLFASFIDLLASFDLHCVLCDICPQIFWIKIHNCWQICSQENGKVTVFQGSKKNYPGHITDGNLRKVTMISEKEETRHPLRRHWCSEIKTVTIFIFIVITQFTKSSFYKSTLVEILFAVSIKNSYVEAM